MCGTLGFNVGPSNVASLKHAQASIRPYGLGKNPEPVETYNFGLLEPAENKSSTTNS